MIIYDFYMPKSRDKDIIVYQMELGITWICNTT